MIPAPGFEPSADLAEAVARLLSGAEIAPTADRIRPHVSAAVDHALEEFGMASRRDLVPRPAVSGGAIDPRFWRILLRRLGVADDPALRALFAAELAGHPLLAPRTGRCAVPAPGGLSRLPDADRRDPDRAPNAATVARRALCLLALTARAQIEYALRQDPSVAADAKAEWRTVYRAVRALGLLADLTRWEFPLVTGTLGEWTPERIAREGWRYEAAGVLLWSLGRVQAVPPYDKTFDDVVPDGRDFEPAAKRLLESPRLLPDDRIRLEHLVAHCWTWRGRVREHAARTGADHRLDRCPYLAGMLEAIRALDPAAIPPRIRGDLALHGRPYRDLCPRMAADAASTAEERHRALSWLQGAVRAAVPAREPGWAWDDVLPDA